jgi:hypothetical protein
MDYFLTWNLAQKLLNRLMLALSFGLPLSAFAALFGVFQDTLLGQLHLRLFVNDM